MHRWWPDVSKTEHSFDGRNVPRKIQTRALDGLAYHGLNSDIKHSY